MASTIRVAQASQPSFGDVRVGVIFAGRRNGVGAARLLLRSLEDVRRCDLEEGESVDLLGQGVLTLDEVHLPDTPDGRAEVTMTFAPPGDG